jgi:hypothetical protein
MHRHHWGLRGFTVALATVAVVATLSLSGAPPARTYSNPLTPIDTADPSVVQVGGVYYAFSTSSGTNNVTEMSTTDLASWPQDDAGTTDALPVLGAWAVSSPFISVWAPSVIDYDGVSYLFYAAYDPEMATRCIGVATSPTVAGPYVDHEASPIVCQPLLGGSIDPDAFTDTHGNLFLAWKSNDSLSSPAAVLWVSRLVPTLAGVALTGTASPVLHADQPWESTMENPFMLVEGDHYDLLFSGGDYDDASYGTGYAICNGPMGPCREPREGPILASDAAVAGPGGASVVTDPEGNDWLAYAAFTPPSVGYENDGVRSLRIDALCRDGSLLQVLGPTTGPTSLTPSCPAAPSGYREVSADGGLFAFGGATFAGSMGGRSLEAPIVGTADTPDGAGYWEVASDGGLFAFGDAPFAGSMGGQRLNEPIVGMAPTPDGGGYWEVASDGGLFAFGDASFYGSTGGMRLDQPIVGMAPTPDGGGYWEVASDGGIFAFGDAAFYGSTGGMRLDKPIVGMAAMPDGGGYWLVAADGGLFAFGDATYHGSTGGVHLQAPIVGMAASPDGGGYWEVAADGGIFAFGDAAYDGSMGGHPLSAPVVGISA